MLQGVETQASPARRLLLGRVLREFISGVSVVSMRNHKAELGIPAAHPAADAALQQQQAASEAAMRELLVRIPVAACLPDLCWTPHCSDATMCTCQGCNVCTFHGCVGHPFCSRL